MPMHRFGRFVVTLDRSSPPNGGRRRNGTLMTAGPPGSTRVYAGFFFPVDKPTDEPAVADGFSFLAFGFFGSRPLRF